MIVRDFMPVIVPESEISFSYARSSGPGGQNVNKTESKAILHWNLDAAFWVPEDVKIRFRGTYGTRINSQGEVVIHSDETRNRSQNENLCVEKLTEMLRKVWQAPKKRIATKPTKASKNRRVSAKRMRSDVKKSRRGSWGDE
jgi:ribosome-associated protein